MTIYFAGTEPEAFTSFIQDPNYITTSGNYHDPDYSRCGLSAYQDTLITIDLPGVGTGLSEGWVQSRIHSTPSLSTSGYPLVAIMDSSGQRLADIITKSSSGTKNSVLRYYTAAATRVEVNPQVPIDPSESNVGHFVTLYWKIVGTSLTLTWYFDSVLAATVTVSVPFMSGKLVKQCGWGGTAHASTSYRIFHSEMIVSSEDPRGYRVATITPNSLGTKDEWTGNYADIDDLGVTFDADYIYTDAINKIESFGLTNLSAAAQNMDVVAAVVSARARRGITGPQNIKPFVRTNSTDYEGATYPSVPATFTNLPPVIMSVNPVTGNPWTITEIQDLEAGFKSLT
ncbi:hypothetical protein POLUDNITSA_00270 [Brevundimonas phage vB_BpoS-Poludnitsa]|nr:hypothetical protein POLUDNITSA_00270 [Brevundimonas phage vB_BpoS-Poludnitsa]